MRLTPTQREEIEKKFDAKFGKDGPEKNCDSEGRRAGCDDCYENIKTRGEHKQFLFEILGQELAKREEAIKDLFRIRGEKPYLWIINNDTPTELGKYDENWRINGYNTAIRDILALLAPTEEK